MKESSFITNNGPSKSYIIIHLSPPNSSKQQRRQTTEPDLVTKCSENDGFLKLQHLNDSRSTQVFPYDLDPQNYSHPKNQSTQTEQLQRRNTGVQTVLCCQSSNASQTVCSIGPFSDETTTGIGNNCSSTCSSYNSNSCSSSIRKAYLNRLMKLKPDEPAIHGPFFCDCPGGLEFCKQYQVR
jgi:hypothetical protein